MNHYFTINSALSLFQFSPVFGGRRFFFAELNKHGLFTIIALMCMAAALVTYLAALYKTFDSGFSLRRESVQTEALAERVMVLELELQKKQADFRLANIPELQHMEKISSIRYIGGESATAYLHP